MSLKIRLLKLIEDEGLNPNQFYIKTGLANGFLNTVGQKLRKPSIEKIERSFPHWNIDYIQNGRGDMFKTIDCTGDNNIISSQVVDSNVGHIEKNSRNSEIRSLKNENQYLKQIVKEKDSIIESLKETIEILKQNIELLKNK